MRRHHLFKKLSVLLMALATASLSGCISSPPKPKVGTPIPKPKGYENLVVTQITEGGWNRKPVAHPDGKSLLFISGGRMDHNNSQAYILNLGNKGLKRLTYQDGTVFEVWPTRQGDQIIYSSSTDEIKEDSDYIRKALAEAKGQTVADNAETDDLGQELPRTEIYQSTLNGNRIERITSNPGFDGDISVRGKRNEVAFVRWSQKRPRSQILNLKTKNTSPIGDPEVWSSDPAYSPTQDELAWIEKSEDGPWLLLTGTAYGKEGKIRHQSSFRIRDLVYHPDGEQVAFAEMVDSENPPNYEIFVFHINTNCKRRVTFHSTLDLEPAFSPDGKSLFFSSLRTGDFQIHQVNLDQLPPCP